jgi:hypothetical protein
MAELSRNRLKAGRVINETNRKTRRRYQLIARDLLKHIELWIPSEEVQRFKYAMFLNPFMGLFRCRVYAIIRVPDKCPNLRSAATKSFLEQSNVDEANEGELLAF